MYAALFVYQVLRPLPLRIRLMQADYFRRKSYVGPQPIILLVGNPAFICRAYARVLRPSSVCRPRPRPLSVRNVFRLNGAY